MTDVPPGRSALAAFLGRRPGWVHSFLLHVAAGLFATAAHYALMFVLLQTGLGGVAATTLGFVAGAVTRFLLSYYHVFAPTAGVNAAMWRFVVALLIQMAANSLLVAALLGAGMHVWVAQVVTTVSLTIFTFLAGRFWVFR